MLTNWIISHQHTYLKLNFAVKVLPHVMGDRNSNQVQLRGDAFELIFYPPRPTLIPHIRDGAMVWEEREPRLVFVDYTRMNLAPGYRNLIYKVNGAIAREVSDTYRMRVLIDPFALVFPKEEYGRVNVDRAVLFRQH